MDCTLHPRFWGGTLPSVLKPPGGLGFSGKKKENIHVLMSFENVGIVTDDAASFTISSGMNRSAWPFLQ